MRSNDAEFAACAGRHRGILLSIARNFARGADVDDLLQDMLLALWHALPSFAGRSAESTFVYRVALNTALTHQRGVERAAPLDPIESDVPDTAADPPALAVLAERERAFEQALASLGRVDRSIVLMHLDAQPSAAIGEVLGMNESAVGARLTRVRRRLALALEGGTP